MPNLKELSKDRGKIEKQFEEWGSKGGKKKGIRSLDSLRKHGWSLKNVIRGNDDDLNGIEHGGDKED